MTNTDTHSSSDDTNPPPLLDIILDTKIYVKVPVRPGSLRKIGAYAGSRNAYCPGCKGETTYRIHPDFLKKWSEEKNLGQPSLFNARRELTIPDLGPTYSSTLLLVATCARQTSHKVFALCTYDLEGWTKVAQYPSEYDMSPEIEQLKKVARGSGYGDLKKASLLHSQGLGAGSFIYLRRAFERLIESYEAERSLPNTGYMSDRIERLKDIIPDFLVQNKSIWGLLSKGVHELDDAECHTAYSAIFPCMLMILQQEQSKKDEEENMRNIQKALNEISSKLS